jgi:ABC-type lipoprotein release transport system permease subunit
VGAEPRDAAVDRREGTAPAGRYISRADEAVLSSGAAAALGVAPGDRILVSVPVDCGTGVVAADCPPADEPFVVAGVVHENAFLGGLFAVVSNQVLSGNVAALSPGTVAQLGDAERPTFAALTARLRGEGGAPDEVLPWMDLAPEVAQYLAMLDVMPVIFFVIIFFAVALGIINTMLMATFERTRELGLMRALGMGSSKVVAMVLWESVLLAVAGIAAGLAMGIPLLAYWETHGMHVGALMTEEQSFDFNGITIDPTLWPRVGLGRVASAVLTIGVMTALSGIWPALRAAQLHPTEALRHE